MIFLIYFKVSRHFGGQGLGEISNDMIEVKNSRVLYTVDLFDNCINHVRMTMAATHRSNTSKTIKVSTAVLIE